MPRFSPPRPRSQPLADFKDRSLENAYAYAALLPHNVAKQPARRFIRRAELRRVVALGDSTIYEMEKRGEFPRRIALLPRIVVWDLTEVEAWMDRCQSDRSSGSFELTKPAGLAKRKARSSSRK